jgi:hypothetical protein
MLTMYWLKSLASVMLSTAALMDVYCAPTVPTLIMWGFGLALLAGVQVLVAALYVSM